MRKILLFACILAFFFYGKDKKEQQKVKLERIIISDQNKIISLDTLEENMAKKIYFKDTNTMQMEKKKYLGIEQQKNVVEKDIDSVQKQLHEIQ